MRSIEREALNHFSFFFFIFEGPENISSFQFVKEGWLRHSGTSQMQHENILARQFEMIPKTEEQSVNIEGEKVDEEKSSAIERWYSIDNDNYEVKSIRVTLLPEAIKVFGASTTR